MYENITYELILNRMLDRVSDQIDKREGSIVWDALSPAAYEMEMVYIEFERILQEVFCDTASSEYLDRVCKMFNITRKPSVKAVRSAAFNVQIPIGERFITMGELPLTFEVIAQTESVNNNYEYKLECQIAGTVGNEYSGQLLPVSYINNLDYALLGKVVISGADEETDEALRERILNKVRRPSTSGNVHDYYNWAMSCPGVGAARVFPLTEGPGTVKVVIVDTDKSAADASLVDSVAQHIESLRPIGATVTVVSAKEKAINVSAKITLSAGISLGAAQNRFQQAVTGYLQGSAFEAGYISLAKMGNLLLEVAGVEDYTELKLNGSAGNVFIENEEVAVSGAVRLEV